MANPHFKDKLFFKICGDNDYHLFLLCIDVVLILLYSYPIHCLRHIHCAAIASGT